MFAEHAPAGVLRYSLRLPKQTPSNNEIKGQQFFVYKKTREAWHLMTKAALKGVRVGRPIERSKLVIIRHSAGVGLDWDNAYGGLKPLLDCLVAPSKRNPSGLALIVDDAPTNMPEAPTMRQEKAKRGEGYTEVLIYSLD